MARKNPRKGKRTNTLTLYQRAYLITGQRYAFLEDERDVPGKPVAWQRVEPGRGGRPHDTARNREEKARIGMLARLAGARPVSGGVELWVTFVFRRPRRHFLRDGTLRPDAPSVHFVKPDADNLLKLVKDALTGVAYCDDCQVARVHMAKEWTETGPPGTTIALEKAL